METWTIIIVIVIIIVAASGAWHNLTIFTCHGEGGEGDEQEGVVSRLEIKFGDTVGWFSSSAAYSLNRLVLLCAISVYCQVLIATKLRNSHFVNWKHSYSDLISFALSIYHPPSLSHSPFESTSNPPNQRLWVVVVEGSLAIHTQKCFLLVEECLLTLWHKGLISSFDKTPWTQRRVWVSEWADPSRVF